MLDFEIGTGYHTDSDDDGLTYPGGDDDKWGEDDGTRALPAEITTAINDFQGDISPTGIFEALNRDGEFHAIAEAEQINRELATSLNRNLDFTDKSLDPDLSLQGAVGNSWDVDEAGDWTIGAMALADYKNQWRNRERINRSPTFPELDTDHTLRTTNQVTLTGSLALGVDYADEHQVQATGDLPAQHRGRSFAHAGQQRQLPAGIRSYGSATTASGSRSGSSRCFSSTGSTHSVRRLSSSSTSCRCCLRSKGSTSTGTTPTPRPRPTSRAKCSSRGSTPSIRKPGKCCRHPSAHPRPRRIIASRISRTP